MKTISTVLSLVTAVVGFLQAEEVVLKDGVSPGGRYEVVMEGQDIVLDGAPVEAGFGYGYGLHIRDAKTGKRVFTFSGIGGYNRFPAARDRCKVRWHDSGEFVTITDQGTRHGVDLHLVAINLGKPKELKLPDYVQNALGRVNATSIDLHSVSTPGKWSGDDLPVDFYFSSNSRPDGRSTFKTVVTLHLVHGQNLAPYVQLKSVEAPQKGDT